MCSDALHDHLFPVSCRVLQHFVSVFFHAAGCCWLSFKFLTLVFFVYFQCLTFSWKKSFLLLPPNLESLTSASQSCLTNRLSLLMQMFFFPFIVFTANLSDFAPSCAVHSFPFPFVDALINETQFHLHFNIFIESFVSIWILRIIECGLYFSTKAKS